TRPPTVRSHRLKNRFAAELWIARALEEVVEHVDAHIEEVAVGVTDVDVDVVRDLRPEGRPVGLDDVPKVVVLLPVVGDLLVDDAGALVPDPLRISVAADGTVGRFPDIPLSARA